MQLTKTSFIIDRLCARLPWSWGWSIALLGGVLLLIPLILFLLEDASELVSMLAMGALTVFFPAIVTIYLLVVVHLLLQTRGRVAQSLRPLLQIDDQSFATAVRRACRANPVGEFVGVGIGAIFFFAVVGIPRVGPRVPWSWIGIYYYFGSMIMFATVGWCVYAVIVISRLTNTLLRQPIEVDIFDVTPFDPIGMQSLYLALSFVGAIVLMLPSSPYALPSWQNILTFIALLLISVLVFFVNMYSTHRLLSSTKKQQLAMVERRFAQTYHQLQELAANRQSIQSVATELNAWAAAKQELSLTRSWPYNTEMLRTLFISVLIPILVGLARVIGPLLGGP